MVVDERFIKTLKTKSYKHMKAVFNMLDDTIDNYNNT